LNAALRIRRNLELDFGAELEDGVLLRRGRDRRQLHIKAISRAQVWGCSVWVETVTAETGIAAHRTRRGKYLLEDTFFRR
jgi:hypothetical protein